MVTLKTFRMSGPVVVIGFVLLVPSIIGILFGGLMLVGSVAVSSQTDSVANRELRTKLEATAIPEPIISDVVASKPIDDSRLVSLTPRQQAAVREAELTASASKLGAGAGAACGFGVSVIIMIGSFVGGLLGWLLIMRKTVLQCVRCGAIVAAS